MRVGPYNLKCCLISIRCLVGLDIFFHYKNYSCTTPCTAGGLKRQCILQADRKVMLFIDHQAIIIQLVKDYKYFYNFIQYIYRRTIYL